MSDDSDDFNSSDDEDMVSAELPKSKSQNNAPTAEAMPQLASAPSIPSMSMPGLLSDDLALSSDSD